MARVYADDIDKLRIPMPASSNWGDPKGRVDPEVLRAASWGTDFDVDARRNAIAAALTPPPAAPAPIGGSFLPGGLGGAGSGNVFGAIPTPDRSVPGTANYAPGSVSPYPPQQPGVPVGVDPSITGQDWQNIMAANPDLAAMNWGNGSSGGFGFSGFDGDSGYLRGFGGIGFGDAGGGTSGGPGSGGPGS